ncbi:MAG: class I SAM-dependent methyltransferase [Phocaeicola sp.]|uniref:class I SAM-dependent methyltransferase n=1 Tax=Phocaeicola sp. TaxID=2773926 RepID=UPI003FA181C5
MKQKMKLNYSNWLPIKVMYIWYLIDIVCALLLVLAFFFSVERGLWKILAGIALFISVFFTFYFYALRRAFAFDKGNQMGKVHEFVANHLLWDGKGKLLDVGCGSGALTIRCAKKWADAQCVGIDYWGLIWDYDKEMCDQNASLEGVADRCSFQKGDAAKLSFPDESFDAVVSNFVYHEVRNVSDKQFLIRETLRVLKKGGYFSLQDFFSQKSLYGDFDAFVDQLKKEGFKEIRYIPNVEKEIPVPKWMRMPGMMTNIGIIYGVK